MKNRNRLGQFAKKTRWDRIVKSLPVCYLIAVVIAITINNMQDANTLYYTKAFAQEVEQPPEVVLGSKESKYVINYNWSEDEVVQAIKNTFPEAPELALAIAKCESNLQIRIEGPTSDFGLMQVHAPTWNEVAKELGYEDYDRNPYHNLEMARYIYEDAGHSFIPWVCFTKGLYKKHL